MSQTVDVDNKRVICGIALLKFKSLTVFILLETVSLSDIIK